MGAIVGKLQATTAYTPKGAVGSESNSARGIRIAILAALWLVPLVLLLLAFHFGWQVVWSSIGVPAEQVRFPDLRSITGALTTLRAHGDPYVANPADPWQRALNYPRIWLGIFSILGINDADVAIPGIAFCLLYLLSVSVLIIRCRRNWEALIVLIAALSLAPLYGIELGNTDLLVFSIVFLGCAFERLPFRASAFFFAAVLKIYPIVALPVEAARRRGKQRFGLLILAILVVVIFGLQWRDLSAIRRATPVSSRMAFGSLAIRQQISEDWSGVPVLQAAASWGAVAGCFLVGAFTAFAAWRSRSPLRQAIRDSANADIFAVFAAIYIFAFAIGSNWDYRLIFLLPTLPLALDLLRKPEHRILAGAYVALLLFAFNPLDLRSFYGAELSHLATLSIFAMLSAGLAMQLGPADAVNADKKIV